MSSSRQVTIWCDGCSEWEQASVSATRLRKELRKQGWTTREVDFLVPGVSEVRRKRDYCPACSKKRAAV